MFNLKTFLSFWFSLPAAPKTASLQVESQHDEDQRGAGGLLEALLRRLGAVMFFFLGIQPPKAVFLEVFGVFFSFWILIVIIFIIYYYVFSL